MSILKDQTAFIVGANGAIAMASARLIARDGGTLFLMGRNEGRLSAFRDEIIAEFPDAQVAFHVGDTFAETDVRAAAQAAYDYKGRLDICVATVADAVTAPVLNLDAAGFTKGMNDSIVPMFLALRYAAELMRDGGAVVCVSSTAAKITMDMMAPYSAGKAGLEQLVRVAAAELGPRNIRVNAVRPGLTRAQTTGVLFDSEVVVKNFLAEVPLGRLGVPEDIGQGIRFLVGPESSWITGQSIAIDGGNELRRGPDTSNVFG